jgi:hypothetical protein
MVITEDIFTFIDMSLKTIISAMESWVCAKLVSTNCL